MTQYVSEATAILCTAAFAGLLWRLLGRWTLYPNRLARIALALFAVLELIVAMGAARAAALEHPLDQVQYLILAHAGVTLAVIALWPHIHRIGPSDA